MIARDLLARFDNVREDGAAQWSARCPGHDDRNNSLSIHQADDGKLLLHCHAGCAKGDILAAIGCTIRDLFPPSQNGHANGKTFGRIVATYDYRDESGRLLYQAVRIEPKDFRQRRPKDGGGWEWKLAGTRRVLYRLPELLAADPNAIVWKPEGEKDTDNMRAIGLVATTNVMGAGPGKWKREYAEALRGRHCVVVPDNDQPGRDHAEAVANSLAGIAASVKVLALAGLPDKGDVSDWLAAGGTADELVKLAEAAPEWTPTAASKPAKAKRRPRLIAIERRPGDSAPAILPDNSPSLKSDNGRTDLSNAVRLVLLHGDRIRWCEPWGKWLVWDGRRWLLDNERQSEALAKSVADAIWAWTADNLRDMPRDQAEEVLRFARYSAGARGIGNMLALARSEPGIPILPEHIDAHPWLLNCANGIVDLKTRELLPHDRRFLLTKLAPVEYIQGPAGECPIWEATLDKIFAGSEELTNFVHRLFGSAMPGEVVEHSLPILWGNGSNGKSLIVETLLEILGDYGGKAAPDLLLAKKGDSHPCDKADLFAKRFVFSVETDDGRRLAEATIKELTGGDRIKARRMREDFWEFPPSHSLFMVTNYRPRVRGQDHGTWRRLQLLPFNVKFWNRDRGETGPAELEADKHLKDKLRAEYGGILRWLVDGCHAWQRNGLCEPAEVKEATKSYKAAEDVLAAFIAECCEIDLRTDHFGTFFASLKASDLRKRLGEWCKENSEKPVSGRRLGDYLGDSGVTKRTSNGTYYDGIRFL
jgi:putative DNA primase/helicase